MAATRLRQQNSDPTGGLPDAQPDGFELDRLTAGLHRSIADLSMSVGEVKSSITAITSSITETRKDACDLDEKVQELRTDQKSNVKSFKVAGIIISVVITFVIFPVLSLISWYAPSYWTDSMRPVLEKSIAQTIKAQLEEERIAREKMQEKDKRIHELELQLKAVLK